jgi:hypothetical protein
VKNKFLVGIMALLLLAATVPAGCERFGIINGSGAIISQQYDLNDFTEIEVSSAFEIEITQSDSYSVSVTTYENIFDYLSITKSGDTLKIGMKSGSYTTANPKATVTLPELEGLKISGASHGSARGFKSSHDFSLEESGASSLDIDMETGDADFELSGASKVSGQLKALDSDMELSGASRADLSGSGDKLNLEGSGASQLNMDDFTWKDASVHLSGASKTTMIVNEELDLDISGASTLNISGNPSLGHVSVTGASTFNKK